MAGCCHCCCLSVVSCQSLSVVGCRSPTAVRWLFFLLHRSLPVDICRIFLALPSRQPHGPSSFGVRAINVCTYKCIAHTHTHTEHVYVQPICCSPVKYCTCNHATLFSSATVQLCNCSTVQLFNCPTCRALSGMESKSYDFRCCRDVVNASPASVASLAFSAASASAARNLCRRHRMNVGYHCSPDCLANIFRLSSPIARREKHKNNKKTKGGKWKNQQKSTAKRGLTLNFFG